MYYKDKDGDWCDSETSKKYTKEEIKENVRFMHRHEKFLFWVPIVVSIVSLVFCGLAVFKLFA